MIGVPFKWYYIISAVVLFRILDIWKPWPIRWIDRNIHGGLGVMLDDVIAALFSLIILQVILQFLK